jgi:hypothetical protein
MACVGSPIDASGEHRLQIELVAVDAQQMPDLVDGVERTAGLSGRVCFLFCIAVSPWDRDISGGAPTRSRASRVRCLLTSPHPASRRNMTPKLASVAFVARTRRGRA